MGLRSPDRRHIDGPDVLQWTQTSTDRLMTLIYDPNDPTYLDEATVRAELSRVFEICHGCQQCVTLCTAFPTLFEMIDRHVDHDPGRMTPADQDQVVDECFHCKQCALGCPYTPDQHEWNVDVPRLMLRAAAMQFDSGITSARERSAVRTMGRTDRLGRIGSRSSTLANKVVGATPGSLTRRLVRAATGVSAVRLLPKFTRQRFSVWFSERPIVTFLERQGAVTVYPTCVVEYLEPEIGHDLVKVYERNGIECGLSEARCCGAPLLYGGDIEGFRKAAEHNVATLAAEVRGGTDIVVPQPTCSYIIRNDYPDHVGGPDAELVAAHTFDAAEYLLAVHAGDGTMLDIAFTGDVAHDITYHAPCHARAQSIGEPSRNLLALTGAAITVVRQSSGSAGMWGLRRGNEAVAVPVAVRLGHDIEQAGNDTVTGDCHLANIAIDEQTGRVAQHPLQFLARAYGIEPEERRP